MFPLSAPLTIRCGFIESSGELHISFLHLINEHTTDIRIRLVTEEISSFRLNSSNDLDVSASAISDSPLPRSPSVRLRVSDVTDLTIDTSTRKVVRQGCAFANPCGDVSNQRGGVHNKSLLTLLWGFDPGLVLSKGVHSLISSPINGRKGLAIAEELFAHIMRTGVGRHPSNGFHSVVKSAS
jgi:hypothetical protein